MKSFQKIAAFAILASLPFAYTQNVTVPTTCMGNFSAGTDTVLYTVPYDYTQVLSVIGSYKNLTWSGNKPSTVTLNGTNNQAGTARTYNLGGSHVIETILTYSKPRFPGPYNEVHNTALLTSGNVQLYIPYDGTVVTSVCGNTASQFNFTAHYCATNATAAGALLHMLHLGDAVTVGKFLGGQNFTNCAALNASGPAPKTMASNTAKGMGSGMATKTGMASSMGSNMASSTAGSSGSQSGDANNIFADMGTAVVGLAAAVLFL